MLERCHHHGHDFHLANGALFVRHSMNPRGLVPVACCWCDKRADLEAYAKGTVQPAESSYAIREHGPFRSGSESAEEIAATSDEELVEVLRVAVLAHEAALADVGRINADPEAAALDTSEAAVLARLSTLRREKGKG